MFLLDEPSAHVYPPQQSCAADLIGNCTDRGSQVFIATHSRDLLLSLCEKHSGKLQVIRLKRNGNETSAHSLSGSELEKLWSNTFIRFSPLLDGLFYKQVVLCEADADCRFYKLIASTLSLPEFQSTMFMPTFTKSRMKDLVEPLQVLTFINPLLFFYYNANSHLLLFSSPRNSVCM